MFSVQGLGFRNRFLCFRIRVYCLAFRVNGLGFKEQFGKFIFTELRNIGN